MRLQSHGEPRMNEEYVFQYLYRYNVILFEQEQLNSTNLKFYVL